MKKNDGGEKVMTYKEKQQEMMTLQSYLQSVLLVYLSQHCDIVIGQPYKKSSKTRQFVKIKIFQFEHETINVPSFVKNRCKECLEIQNKKGVSEKTAKRRIQTIKRQQIMHLIMDILFLKGIFVRVQIEDGEGIDGEIVIFTKKQTLFEKERIEQYGLLFNTFFCNQLKDSKQITLRYSDIKRDFTDGNIEWKLFECQI